MRYRTRLVACLVGMVAALALATPAVARSTPTPTTPVQLCEISVTIAGQWSNGFVVNVNVRNISNRPVTVHATVNVQPPGYVVQGWGATFTASGTTLWIRPWNPVLPPGASMTFGYTGTGPITLPTVYCQ
jgi:cellulase/cellobiase CelA1